MKKITLKQLFENALHFGHKRCHLNPKMKPYIYMTKNNVDIINLQKTLPLLEEIGKFIETSIQGGKTVLFVGTKPQAKKITQELATSIQMPFMTHKWLPGFLTNFDTIKKRLRYLETLEREIESGKLEEIYTKKEVLKKHKKYSQLQLQFEGVRKLAKKPDILFIVDTKKEHNAINEARLLNIPIVAIVDTNSSPDNITHIIPANDDSTKSLKFILEYIGSCKSK
jgi:small subunit ribosomal protein S2